jgi:hypothetical protein
MKKQTASKVNHMPKPVRLKTVTEMLPDYIAVHFRR